VGQTVVARGDGFIHTNEKLANEFTAGWRAAAKSACADLE